MLRKLNTQQKDKTMDFETICEAITNGEITLSALDITNLVIAATTKDDVINYLGSNSTAKDVNEMFFEKRNSVSRYVWLRSAYSDYSGSAFYVNGYSGSLSDFSYYGSSREVRPAFVLDLSLLS